MTPVSTSKESNSPAAAKAESRSAQSNLIGLAASGTLLAGAVLLLAGRKRAGAVTAASGAALAMLDQQETLRSWWRALPETIEEVQKVLVKVQDAVNDVAVRRERLERILTR